VGLLPYLLFFIIRGLLFVSFPYFLSAFLFLFFLYIAFPSIVFHPSISTGAVVGALGRGVSWLSSPAGDDVGFVGVEAIVSWHSGYLIMRVSSTS
jgi:hypothetical protein